MIVLGLDPSLTNYGWAVHDDSHPIGSTSRCSRRGRFQTPADMTFVDRYIAQRESLRALIREVKPDRVGIEFPVFDNLFSEGMIKRLSPCVRRDYKVLPTPCSP